jgi:FtsP/CotA-like multicopper oxidase with cupredoxin domain
VKRRNFLQLAAAAAATAPTLARSQLTMLPGPGTPTQSPDAGGKADISLRIAPVTVELSPNRIVSTIGYNGTSPGPILRMPAGKPISVDVINATDTPELVHWHGFLIPGDVDGVEEQGTPFVPPQGHHRYTFTPGPTGLRWYHSHAMAMSDLHKGAYTGQFGFVVVEGANPALDAGAYDQEVFLALRDWEPFFASLMADTDEEDDPNAPQPEKPQVLNTDANGIEVNSMTYSINDKSLGSGEPIRVKQGQRILLRVLNASAIENRRLSLPGHKFKVLALDGNPVPNPALVETLFLGAGERIDAVVEMTNPGIWIMGAPEDAVRDAGLGVVVEYAGQHKSPQWIKPADLHFDYTAFGKAADPAAKAPDATIEMIFEKIPRAAGKFNLFTINGKSYPHENEFVLKQGLRYRLIMRNRTDDSHPMHLHRHQLELVDINGKKTSGIIKDTVIVPFYGRATVDFTADQPGLTLFHCHIQQHMDFGFKALFRYS